MQTKALLTGQPYEPPSGRFSDLNAKAIASSRGTSVAELLSRFRSANEALCGLYMEHNTHTIVLQIKIGAKPRTLAELVREVEAHIRNHHRKLVGEFHRN